MLFYKKRRRRDLKSIPRSSTFSCALSPSSIVVFFFFVATAVQLQVGALKIKWTPNLDDPDPHDPAKTAPRSQKYWDEHNIVRPDYAKTDAEIAAERRGGKYGDGGGSFSHHPVVAILCIALLGAIPVGALWYLRNNNNKNRVSSFAGGGASYGNRLGTTTSMANRRGSFLFDNLISSNLDARRKTGNDNGDSALEKARRARLARFDVGDSANANANNGTSPMTKQD